MMTDADVGQAVSAGRAAECTTRTTHHRHRSRHQRSRPRYAHGGMRLIAMDVGSKRHRHLLAAGVHLFSDKTLKIVSRRRPIGQRVFGFREIVWEEFMIMFMSVFSSMVQRMIAIRVPITARAKLELLRNATKLVSFSYLPSFI
ncbi:hypothetical protein ZWY2020_020368 [Hordeum vulgare]|nr:hypothetical protein ZWY2020_020368 [Hordeum vulgare]